MIGHHHPAFKAPRQAAGLFRTSDSTKVSVLNGSIRSISDNDDNESVLVFPDFKVVTQVQSTVQGAQDLWDSSLDPSVSRTGAFLEKSQLKTWVLPYSCVILLCESVGCSRFLLSSHLCRFTYRGYSIGSHRKRDNRCGISAPKLEHGSWTPFILYSSGTMGEKKFNFSKNSSHSIIGASWVGCGYSNRMSILHVWFATGRVDIDS